MGIGRVLGMSGLIALAGVMGFWLMRPKGDNAKETQTPRKGDATETPPAREVTWETLAEDLGSPDERLKGAALAFVAKAHYRKRDALWALREQMKDPSIRTALGTKLDEMYELLATNPPPISLHVHEATLKQVMEVLNEEMGTHIRWNQRGDGGGSYTLDVEGMAFWEVIVLLAKQGKFAVSPFTEVTFSMSSTGMERSQISGPFFIYASTGLIGVTQPPSFMVHYTVVADPRLPIAELKLSGGTGPTGGGAELGADSAGNVLRHLGGGSVQGSASWGLTGSMQTYWPDNPGKTISYLKTHVTVTTMVPAASVSVEKIEEKQGWESDVGEAHVKVPTFSDVTQQQPFTLVTVLGEVTPAALADKMVFQIYTNENRLAWAARGSAGMVSASIRGVEEKPYRLVATLGKRMHELGADLEIKDLPEPPR